MADTSLLIEKVAKETERKRHIVSVAKGDIKADIVLKNADYVNVYSSEMCHGDIAICGNIIVGVGNYSGETEYDMTGKVVVPGFIDSHMHIESTLLTPREFAKAAIKHGVTTVICDPHEIANVLGVRGIDYMIDSSIGIPLDVLFMLPSCVPSVDFEENGATLSWRDLNMFMDYNCVLGMAEMMNYTGVINGDTHVLNKIALSQAYHKKIDGHAPGLSGEALNAYMSAGVYSDHECDTMEDAMNKLRIGQYIMIREGTAAQNLEALVSLIKPETASRCMFCSDDRHPGDLLGKGHIDYVAKKAVSLGADPLLTVQVASKNAASYFKLNNKGAIAPGFIADLAILGNIRDFDVQTVFKSGKLIYDGGDVALLEKHIKLENEKAVYDTCHLPDVMPDRLICKTDMPLIGVIPGQITTRNLGLANGIDVSSDTLKLVVAERHRYTGHIACSYIRGYGLKSGAVATSIAHDSHNIIAVGAADGDIAIAINAVKAMRGGMVVVNNGNVVSELPLPVAGLMSEQPLDEVDSLLEKTKSAAYALGVSRDIDPFMTMSFISLPVIPSLRLVTKGVFDVEKWEFISESQP